MLFQIFISILTVIISFGLGSFLTVKLMNRNVTLDESNKIINFINSYIDSNYLQDMTIKVLMKDMMIYNDKEITILKNKIVSEIVYLTRTQFKINHDQFSITLIQKTVNNKLYDIAVAHNIQYINNKSPYSNNVLGKSKISKKA